MCHFSFRFRLKRPKYRLRSITGNLNFFYIFSHGEVPGHTPLRSILEMKPYFRRTKIIKALFFAKSPLFDAAKLPEGPAKSGATGRVLRTTGQSSQSYSQNDTLGNSTGSNQGQQSTPRQSHSENDKGGIDCVALKEEVRCSDT